MSRTAPPQLTISGTAYHGNPLAPAIGDVRLCPGANRTNLIDAYIFDGWQWRGLDLSSFGGVPRTFYGTEEIGALMRNATSAVSRCKGMPVHYQRVGASKKSKYVFRGIPFASLRL
jgi:hypothetical protein